MKLNKIKEKEYGPFFKNHLLEQYHLYVDGIDKLNVRRQKTNDFFLAINTATLAFLGVVNKVIENDSPFLIFIASIFGIFLSFVWYKLINAYREINRSKYQILHILEKELPVALFTLEWDVLGKGVNKKIYTPITHVEIIIPIIFIIFYILLTVSTYGPYLF